MVKIYKQPFAHDGDAIAIPDASQPDGKMSSADGWTPDYQLPKTDPNYKPVGRQEMNGVFKEVTEAVGELQQFGFAKWQAITWPQGARVVEGGVVYRALTQTSQQPPHADWVPDINSILQPSITGSITLNGTTDNTVVMTDIVPQIGLETGDVIRIDTGTYNKLHTVENIENNNQIRVNFEHAGNRGNGSLRLPDFTGQATVTRIAKWYNAPLGMGQAWVSVFSLRGLDVTYTNTAGRTTVLSITFTKTTGCALELDGQSFGPLVLSGVTTGTGGLAVTSTFLIRPGGEYRMVTYSGVTKPIIIMELR